MSNPIQNLLRTMLVTLGVCLSLCCPAFAQTITGSITGTVTDATGAVVPGAKVTATNVDTGVSVSDVSNGAGIYSIRFLQIGKYKVQTEAAGFSTQSYGPFSLEIDQVAKVTFRSLLVLHPPRSMSGPPSSRS